MREVRRASAADAHGEVREEWPGYEVTFRDGGRHRGVGIAVGILIGR
jgi:hypothetical protein